MIGQGPLIVFFLIADHKFWEDNTHGVGTSTYASPEQLIGTVYDNKVTTPKTPLSLSNLLPFNTQLFFFMVFCKDKLFSDIQLIVIVKQLPYNLKFFSLLQQNDLPVQTDIDTI